MKAFLQSKVVISFYTKRSYYNVGVKVSSILESAGGFLFFCFLSYLPQNSKG